MKVTSEVGRGDNVTKAPGAGVNPGRSVFSCATRNCQERCGILARIRSQPRERTDPAGVHAGVSHRIESVPALDDRRRSRELPDAAPAKPKRART